MFHIDAYDAHSVQNAAKPHGGDLSHSKRDSSRKSSRKVSE